MTLRYLKNEVINSMYSTPVQDAAKLHPLRVSQPDQAAYLAGGRKGR